MKQIAIYGKGGIGKSTVATHLSYAIANRGCIVLQVGCDPKSDSTHNLVTDYIKPILNVLAENDFDYESISMDDIVHKSPLPYENGGFVYFAAAGGPGAGGGCGGEGGVVAGKKI